MVRKGVELTSLRLASHPPWGYVNRRSKTDVLRVFGLTVRAYRLQAGLTQEKLADRAGVDRTYVGGVERGERNVGLVNLVRLADALGVAPSHLLERFAVGEIGADSTV